MKIIYRCFLSEDAFFPNVSNLCKTNQSNILVLAVVLLAVLLSFSPFRMMLATGLLWIAFIVLRCVPHTPSLQILYHEEILNFVKGLFVMPSWWDPKKTTKDLTHWCKCIRFNVKWQSSAGTLSTNWHSSCRQSMPGLRCKEVLKDKTTSRVVHALTVQHWVRVGDLWIHWYRG